MNMIEYTIYFVPVLIGFIFGEILLQSNRHVTIKWRFDREGLVVCLEHTILYTACILASLWVFCSASPLNLAVLISIFISHFVIEKFPITQMWMTYMKIEHSPMYNYFERKLPSNIMETGQWIEHAMTLPELTLNEYEINSTIFFLNEYMVVNRLLQLTTTFLTVVCLGWLGYI